MIIKPPNGSAPQYRLSMYTGVQLICKCGIPVKGMTLSVPDDCDAVVYALLDLSGQAMSTFLLTETGWAVFTEERLKAKLDKPAVAPEPEPEPEPELEPEPEPESMEFDDDFFG